MKKIIFAIIFSLVSIVAHCQIFDSTQRHRKGFYLEPLAGIGTSEAVQNGTNNLGWKAGCGVVYMFNNHWGISSGLQAQRYSNTFVSGKDSMYATYGTPPYWGSISVNTTYNFTYLELPIMIRYLSSKD